MSGAQEYVKVASSHLTRAASELSRQAQESRADHDNNKRQLEKEITRLEGEIRSIELNIATTPDSNTQTHRIRSIADLRRDIQAKKEQIQQEEADKQRELRVKQDMSTQLGEEARGLHTLAANPDLG